MDNKKKNILEIINMQEYNVLAYMEDSPVRLKAQNKNWTIIIYKNYVTEEIEIHFSNDIKEINGYIDFSFDELPFEELNIIDPQQEFINDFTKTTKKEFFEKWKDKNVIPAEIFKFIDFPKSKNCKNQEAIHSCLHCNKCGKLEEMIYKQAANENIRFMEKALQEDKERNGYK